mmetsp:Transcript_29747/g.77916  ORF Transcript_29747/g.77916 Transcript_29747/m.77916 type:complete len:234 (+) Transcript_29747:733-1434(+)
MRRDVRAPAGSGGDDRLRRVPGSPGERPLRRDMHARPAGEKDLERHGSDAVSLHSLQQAGGDPDPRKVPRGPHQAAGARAPPAGLVERGGRRGRRSCACGPGETRRAVAGLRAGLRERHPERRRAPLLGQPHLPGGEAGPAPGAEPPHGDQEAGRGHGPHRGGHPSPPRRLRLLAGQGRGGGVERGVLHRCAAGGRRGWRAGRFRACRAPGHRDDTDPGGPASAAGHAPPRRA